MGWSLIGILKDDMSDFGDSPASIDGKTQALDDPNAKVKNKVGWNEFVGQCQKMIDCAQKIITDKELASVAREQASAKERAIIAAKEQQAEQQNEKERQDYWDKFLAQAKTMKKQNVDFNKAIFEPEKYKDRILVSTVQIVNVSFMRVWVHSLGLGQDQALSCSSAIFEKALRVIRIVAEQGIVKIEYTVSKPVDGSDQARLNMPCIRLVDITVE